MSPLRVVFLRLAAQEYRRARNWHARNAPQALFSFLSALEQAIDRIVRENQHLPLAVDDYHWVRLPKHRYVMIFHLRMPGVATVVALAHTSRRPGYWRRRK